MSVHYPRSYKHSFRVGNFSANFSPLKSLRIWTTSVDRVGNLMLATVTNPTRRLLSWFCLSKFPRRSVFPHPFPEIEARLLRRISARVRPYTMTSKVRVAALCQSVAYLEHRRIPGDFVECGVWRGGSMMAVALTLLDLGAQTRRLHLFDTFEGMPAPSDADRDLHGQPAEQYLDDDRARTELICPLDQVRQTLAGTGYDPGLMSFVAGKVETTLPAAAPDQIALLRLDTDWYASTRHELRHLYPRLVPGGVLIIDDYGHWQGARQAVDEYFAEAGIAANLHEIDYTGRLHFKAA
jgi:O-methyltransferase